MSLRRRILPVLGIIGPCHARHSDFRRDHFTTHRDDVRLGFFRDGTPMTKPDRGQKPERASGYASAGGLRFTVLDKVKEPNSPTVKAAKLIPEWKGRHKRPPR